MKVTITKGMTVNDAFTRLKQLIEGYSQDYDILKSNLNIYFNLKNSDNEICPQNDKIYRIDSNGVHDVQKEMEQSTISSLQTIYGEYLETMQHKLKRIEDEIRAADNYLATANEKRRKPENIEKRRKAREKLEGEKEYLNLILSEFFQFDNEKRLELINFVDNSDCVTDVKAYYINEQMNEVFHWGGMFCKKSIFFATMKIT